MTQHVRVLTSLDALERLAPEWGALCDATASLTPFQRPEWALTWARRFVRGPVRSVAVREGGELVCLLPLFLHCVDGERRLRLLGDGLTDHLDAITSPSAGRAAVECALDALRSVRGDWDACQFVQLSPSSPLAVALPSGWSFEVEPGEACPGITVADGERTLEGLLRKSTLENVKKARRRARQHDAPLACERRDEVDIEAALDEFFALHAMRWRREGRSGVFSEEAVRAFHHAAARALGRLGILRLHRVRLGDATIGMLYGMLEKGRLYLYAQAYRPDSARVSPGVLAIAAAIEDGLREGIRDVDFLRGAEAYKYAWGARDRPTLSRRVRLL